MTAKREDITDSLLRKLYLDKNLSAHQIGKLLKCHPTTVTRKLHEYGIVIRNPVRRVGIKKKELIDLYIKRGLSTYKIALFFGCNVRTITNKMRSFHIKARPIQKGFISKGRLVTLYQRKKLSLKKIGLIYKMSPSGIFKRVKKYGIPLRNSWETNTGTKLPFRGATVEKAYLIGFRIGDLGVRQSSERTKMIIVGSNTTKSEQVFLIKNLFSKFSKVWVSSPNPIGVVGVSTILHPSFSFLLPKKDSIEEWIKLNNKYMRAFVAGYVDAEGSFGVYNDRAKFRLGSYDKTILREIYEWFKKQKVKSLFELERKKKLGQNKDFWRITINEAGSLLLFCKIIRRHIRHEKRRNDLKKVLKNINLRRLNGTIRL